MQGVFCSFAENAANAMAIVDGEGRLAFVNRRFRTLLTQPGNDVVGRRIRDCGLPDGLLLALASALGLARQEEAEQAFAWDEAAAGTDACREHGEDTPPDISCGDAGEGDDTGLEALRRHRGRVVPVEGTAQYLVEISDVPISDRLKEALKVERTIRRRSEYLKKRGRELFFKVIDELPVFVYMQRPDYTVAYANKKTRNFYGETEGRRCYEVFSGLDSPCSFCPTFRVFETGAPEDWQFTDSKGRTFRIYDYPFEDENGEPLVMELGVEVTELKRVERELFQAQKMRAIGVLAGGIAHDLNNNLVPIIFNVDYALGKTGDPGVAEPLEEALRAAYRAADLVEQVLEYSRQQNLSRSTLHLVPLAQENLALLQASLPKSVTLEVRCNTTEDCIAANPAQIQQLLLNLCRNAVQAMPEGGTLSVAIDEMQVMALRHPPHLGVPLGEYVVLRVEDTGHGIEPDRIEQIFEPFYTSKRNSGGTGMGLAVVHAIITSNGGRIFVDSELGKGTVFTVYLPRVQPVEAKSVQEEAVYAPPRSAVRLLLVDDDQGAMLAMRRVLREAGFEVITADNGERGLATYFGGKGPFDLVLADQSMPGLSGIDMARRILERDRAARIVICTGHVGPNLEGEAAAAGIAGFLMKPMTPGRLVENIRRLCG